MQSKNFKAIGERIKQVRKDAGMTQAKFAELLNSSDTFLSRVESGKQKPSHGLIESISKHFGVSIGWLYAAESDRIAESSTINYGQSILPEKSSGRAGLLKRARSSADVGCLMGLGDNPVPGRYKGYGYARKNGIKLRLFAGEDEALNGSNLLKITIEDNLWVAIGEPTGVEFEILRAYYEWGDRAVDEWFECLRTLRWVRECIALHQAETSGQDDSALTA